MTWHLSASSNPRVLNVVDGTGPFEGLGPHYSRRTPGSKTFTGIGREVVLLHSTGRAVWACVYQATPSAAGTGASRGRTGKSDTRPRYLWRNNLFRNLGAGLSSALIVEAVEATYREWVRLYGALPTERLRTEIDIGAVRSVNPGCCYRKAGWEVVKPDVKGKRYFYAPPRPETLPAVGQALLFG